jgi:hypothetical protein
MLLVLMRIGPPSLYVHGRLTTSPFSVDRTVYRCLHTLPTVLFGLAVPDLDAWLEVPSAYTITSIITSTVRQQCQCTKA